MASPPGRGFREHPASCRATPAARPSDVAILHPDINLVTHRQYRQLPESGRRPLLLEFEFLLHRAPTSPTDALLALVPFLRGALVAIAQRLLEKAHDPRIVRLNGLLVGHFLEVRGLHLDRLRPRRWLPSAFGACVALLGGQPERFAFPASA